MGTNLQIRSLGRFLYTQNPFYLISCFLIIYGLQIAAVSRGDLFLRSVFLTFTLAAYTLLMTVTCIGVVRLGKVWEDARSILLVVIISQVALSTGLDEYCVIDWHMATGLLSFSALFSFAVTELVIRSCRLRFPSWYRLSFYSMLLIFFMTPVVLGHAVGDRQIRLTNWGAPIFSALVAAALLWLIPAVRQGASLVADNGTPWRWPLYPLSAFVILIVVACIRTHAVWMSFGFIGAPVRFEPFLLLPIALAILILVVQSDSPRKATSRTYWAMGIAPAMLVCGVSRGGMTHLPIQADLQTYFGSAITIALVAILGFYFLVWTRGVKGSEFALTATLLALCGISDLPEVAESAGAGRWMYAGIASLVMLVICLRDPMSDRKWLAFTMVGVVTILMAGHDYDRIVPAAISAAGFATAAMLAIGALFETQLAAMLRQIAAGMLVTAAIGVVIWHVARTPGMMTLAALSGMSAVTILYLLIVKRLGWLGIFAVQAACLIGVLGWTGVDSGSLRSSNWPIPSGLLCFVIGLAITSVKTGAHRKLRSRLPQQPSPARYRSGL